MNVSKERVLVTGAGGFIGSHLSEFLVRRGAEVRAVVHYNSRNDWGYLETVPAEVRDALEVRAIDVADSFAVHEVMEGCGVVFHLAALIGIPYSYVAPGSYLETNVRGTLNVLEAARRRSVKRVVHTSSSEVYGTARYTPIDEEHPLQGQSPYSASKIAADKLAESYHRSFGVPVTVLRPFNTYGPRQSARAVIPTVIAQIAQGASRLRLGNLEPVRDFTYVTDTARAFVAVAESDRAVGSVVNVASGKGISIGELARKILGLMKADIEIVSAPERLRLDPSEVHELVGGTERIRSLTDWRPDVELEPGLVRAIDYVRERITTYKTGTYVI